MENKITTGFHGGGVIRPFDALSIRVEETQGSLHQV